ncbi:uncharacterized protein LOC117742893 [Cyclopterus lumpus]|uniref:uncharacterized protein LOC117742893 n=1 Tax=Cyclopterus lumpus TaxID=8103 RepID=UPI001486ADA3|nr:uncharacterized protein LOC117742893 [Cyclopterus lumpus]
MLSRESVAMREGRDNPLALSSKTPRRGQTDRGWELERLRADWEAEKQRTQRAREHLSVELRHLREVAEREQQKATRELAARRGAQKDGPSHGHWGLLGQEADGKGGGRRAEKEVFCLCGGETYRKLEHLLLTLYEKINDKQAVYKLHHRKESELEKAVFLCHLLEAHGRVLQRRQRAGHPGYVFNSLSRKTTQGDSGNSCRTRPLLTYSGAVPHGPQTASRSPKKKPKPAQREQPSGSRAGVCAADPCTADAVADTCQSGPLRICPRDEAPHAGWDEQPPSCGESSGSDESPPSTCMDRNMEVSYF